MRPDLPLSLTHEIRDRCLCLHVQRAARALARRFDEALRPLGITSGQFSILAALNQPEPPGIGRLAQFLAMDRTTLTAALKPLERRGLVTVTPDPKDRRNRRPALSDAGRDLLAEAVPVWRAAHDLLDADVAAEGAEQAAPDPLRAALLRIAARG